MDATLLANNSQYCFICTPCCMLFSVVGIEVVAQSETSETFFPMQTHATL